MQLFGSLKLLMALLGSSCPLFGRSGPKMGPKMVPKNAQKRNQRLSIFFYFVENWIWLNIKKLKASSEAQIGPNCLHKIRNRFTRETKMSPRGPSWALKSQTPAFKKPEKTLWFLMFLGPETSQETLKKPKSRPRSTQRAPKARKKSTKKNQDKCLRGKKCLKVAISF